MNNRAENSHRPQKGAQDAAFQEPRGSAQRFLSTHAAATTLSTLSVIKQHDGLPSRAPRGHNAKELVAGVTPSPLDAPTNN